MRRAFVVGAGETGYHGESGRTEQAMAVEAIGRAIDDAGLRPEDVDGLVRFALDSTSPGRILERMGLGWIRYSGEDASGGASAPALVGHAQAAIAAGRADVVVCYRSFNGRSGRRFGRPPPGSVGEHQGGSVARGKSPIGGEFAGPYGLVFPVQVFALWCRAYLAAETVREQDLVAGLEAVAVSQRAHAALNPKAALGGKPLTAEGYRQSPLLADPLRLADLCVEVDGACALVVAAEERVRRPAARLLGVTQAVGGSGVYEDFFLRAGPLPPRIPDGWIPDWLRSLGVAISAVKHLSTYDACTANVIFDVETAGLCRRGEGHRWVRGPSIPYNTSGGHLAEGYLQGMNQVVEAFRRARGGTRYALVLGGGCGSAALMAAV